MLYRANSNTTGFSSTDALTMSMQLRNPLSLPSLNVRIMDWMRSGRAIDRMRLLSITSRSLRKVPLSPMKRGCFHVRNLAM